MKYEIIMEWNDYVFCKNFDFSDTNMIIYKVFLHHPLLSILFSPYSNFFKLTINNNGKVVLDEKIKIPTKLYKLYSFNNKKLYCHCVEFEEFIICIDIVKKYKLKYFKSIFIMKKE